MLKNIVLLPSSCGQLKKGVKNFPGFILVLLNQLISLINH